MTSPARDLTPTLAVLHSRLFSYNAGVFTSDGQACLIDPGIFADETDRLAYAAGERNAAPRCIVVTHSHWDHVLGPERFPGVMLVQQAESLAVLGEYGFRVERHVMEWERQSGVTREHPFEMPEPDETFGERMELPVGRLALLLVHTPGHAPEHLAVFEPESGALWAGDMLSDIEIPYVMHSLAAYRKTLEALGGLDTRALVPGHGSVTTDRHEVRRRFSEDAAYLSELEDRVGRAVKEGRAVEEAVAECRGMEFRHRDANRHSHRLNVESAFVELGGTAPEGAGWNRLQ